MVGEGDQDTLRGEQPAQESDLRFDVDGQKIEVDLNDVEKLFVDMDRYNQQFSMGSMMARMITSRFKPEEGEKPSSKTGLSDEEGKQQMDAFFLKAAHKGVLGNIGLSVEPVSGKTATMMVAGDSAQDAQMRVNIGDRDRFTSFLAAVDPDQIEKTDLKKHLEELSSILSKQVLDHYNFETNIAGDEVLQLFGGLEKIITEYKRLGMGKAVEKLEVYLMHGRDGDLREYVSIERRGLLSEPGKSFGPGDWQTDSTPDHLESRWSEATGILRMARDNPKASKLHQQLQEHLFLCVDLALESVESLEYLSDETRRRDREILSEAKERINELTQKTSKA